MKVQLLGPHHPAVTLVYTNLAGLMLRNRDYKQAKILCDRALAIWSGETGAQDRSDLAFITLADIDLVHADYASALDHLNLAFQTFWKSGLRDQLWLAEYYHTLALAHEGSGEFSRSETAFREALRLLEETHRSGTFACVSLLEEYSTLLGRMKRKPEAAKLRKDANVRRALLVKENKLGYTIEVSDFVHEKSAVR